jgi:hypothetical protein
MNNFNERLTFVFVLLIGLGLGLLVVGIPGNAKHTVSGVMSLDPGEPLTQQYRRALRAAGDDVEAADRAVVGTDCSRGYPTTGYDDIRSGAPVTVSNENGTTIAVGTLGPGRVSKSLRCVFIFSVSVPKAKFYRFEVSHRGQVQKSFDEMKADGWIVSLTLG